ncbi:hypothetical protein BH09BAC2_BH09BAC2_18710 [soil metagenome]
MPASINYKKNIYKNFFCIAPGVWGMSYFFTNIFMILNPFDGNWVLVDTGYKRTAAKIKKMAAQLFGYGHMPSAIILTHAHFDHSGGLHELCNDWKVPVYAHADELCFLVNNASYPPPDLTLAGGIFSLVPGLFPCNGMELKGVSKIPLNGIPGLPQWNYINTPGHSPGHISLYRESDGVLLAGDALCNVNRHSLIGLFKKNTLSGPSKFFTYNWHLAKQSIKKLAHLRPAIIASSHGKPLKGNRTISELNSLLKNFNNKAVPVNGVYTKDPAVINKSGIIYVTAQHNPSKKIIMKFLSLIALAGVVMVWQHKRRDHRKLQQILAYEIW